MRGRISNSHDRAKWREVDADIAEAATPTLNRLPTVAQVEQITGFSAARPQDTWPAGQVGPNSNTGPKSSQLTEPLIDFLTIVLPEKALKRSGCSDYREMFDWIFGTGAKIVMGAILDRTWQFHPQSATLIDETGEVAGKVGFAESGKICISVSGHGTRHVTNWRRAEEQLGLLDAYITRLDIAVDDLTGETFRPEIFRDAWHAGEFTSNGRPPEAQFISDEGSGKGCTLYIGQKGHKQLCIYEKGKQLGDPDSQYTRCELRLYAQKTILPLSALSNLREHFAGAYPLLAQYIVGEATKLLAKEAMVNASAVAMVRTLRQQAGTALRLCIDAMPDAALEFLLEHVARPGIPGRFKGVTGDLPTLLRNELTKGNENESDDTNGR